MVTSEVPSMQYQKGWAFPQIHWKGPDVHRLGREAREGPSQQLPSQQYNLAVSFCPEDGEGDLTLQREEANISQKATALIS